MLFKRRSSSQKVSSEQSSQPCSGHTLPSNVSVPNYPTPDAIEAAPALSANPPTTPRQEDNTPQSQRQLERTQSSEYYLHILKEPRSRKIGPGTIRTDATTTQPAFESDAFAIQMPTTREPILDQPIFNEKLPCSSQEQVEAYRLYKQKAQQVRERNDNEGVHVPPKIISYDSGWTTNEGPAPTLAREVSRPASTIQFSPADSLPASPPMPQQGWSRLRHQSHVHSPRSLSDSSDISIPRKPIGVGHASSAVRPRYPRGQTDTGAARSPTPSPTLTPIKIRVRLKPKMTELDCLSKESHWTTHNRSLQSSTTSSRAPSPEKPSFAYTTPGTADAIFGYKSNGIAGTSARGEIAQSRDHSPQKPKTPKHAQTSRWAWLKPPGSRPSQPAGTQSAPIAAAKSNTYVNPFALHATPTSANPPKLTASGPALPKKLTRPALATSAHPVASERGKFETGFAQVTSLCSLIIKVCLVVYALVGVYFLVDAIREVVHALGAPFRAMKLVGEYIWVGGAWAARVLAKGWQRWG